MDGQTPQGTNTGQHSLPGVAPGVPTAALPLAPAQNAQQSGPVQQAMSMLMDPQRSPHDTTRDLASVKEDYLLKTYGVTIE